MAAACAVFLLALPACRDIHGPARDQTPTEANTGVNTEANTGANTGDGDLARQAAGPGAPDRAGTPAPSNLRQDPTKLDLGSGPIRNPLNLYDVGISGAPDMETVGMVDGVRITTQDLEAQSVGAFTRIAERIYQAEDGGYRWLIERVALGKQAARASMPLIPFLLQEYAKLPQPSEDDLALVLSQVPLVPMSEDEQRHTATSLWRLAAWEQRREELVLAGRAELGFERLRLQISNPTYGQADTVVARIDGNPVTRAELRVLAGYEAELARHEYWRLIKMQFDRYVSRFLREREAQHLGVTVAQLEALEVERIPAPTDAEVAAYMKENPEYADHAEGRERARDNLRRLRAIQGGENLDARLRATAEVRFFLDEPRFERFPVEVPAPRWYGSPQAENVIVAFHGVGCETCTRGSRLLLSILSARADTFKVLAGDYFAPGQLGSYRGALALHCAPPDRREELLRVLTVDFGSGEIGDLVRKAGAAGIDRDRLGACLRSDQLLPLIVENLAMARRLGLQSNVPALFVNGVRIGELKDLDKVLEQIDRALQPVGPA